MTHPTCQVHLSLRERKSATTKVGLMNAALACLKSKPFSAITVKELCEQVQISEATFFNYFKKKDDLLRYFTLLWNIRVGWYAQQASLSHSGLQVIEALFTHTGRNLIQNPRALLEVIGFMALHTEAAGPRSLPHTVDVCLAERLEAYPDLQGIEAIPLRRLPDLFREQLQRAFKQGEVVVQSNLEPAVQALVSAFFGVPLWLRGEPERIPSTYQQQLQLLWQGLGNTHGSATLPAERPANSSPEPGCRSPGE